MIQEPPTITEARNVSKFLAAAKDALERLSDETVRNSQPIQTIIQRIGAAQAVIRAEIKANAQRLYDEANPDT